MRPPVAKLSSKAYGPYPMRPIYVDCKKCRGRGRTFINQFQEVECPTCFATGLDPIPWSELLRIGRGCLNGEWK